MVAERGHHLLALVLSHQAVVDEHAGELLADGAVHDQRRGRRVDAARQPADHVRVADLLADRRHLLVDDRGRAPGPFAAADLVQEVLAGCRCRRACARPRGGTGSRTGRARPTRMRRPARPARRRAPSKPGGGSKTVSRWLIQQLCSAGEAGQQAPGLVHAQLGATELADLGALDAAAELARHRLHAVTDAEHGHAELEQLGAQLRRALVVDRGGTAGEHDARAGGARVARRAARRVAAAPRRRRTRGSGARSAASTDRRSRAPAPLCDSAAVLRVCGVRSAVEASALYSSSSLTAAATWALPFEPMPTCCSRWSCLPSL